MLIQLQRGSSAKENAESWFYFINYVACNGKADLLHCAYFC